MANSRLVFGLFILKSVVAVVLLTRFDFLGHRGRLPYHAIENSDETLTILLGLHRCRFLFQVICREQLRNRGDRDFGCRVVQRKNVQERLKDVSRKGDIAKDSLGGNLCLDGPVTKGHDLERLRFVRD